MNIYTKYELTCKPLDTYSEVLMFLQQPPAWRTLCKEMKPHSTRKIRNKKSNADASKTRETLHDGLDSFCHIAPDAEQDVRADENDLPKTLVCHDMANGYHDDSIIDGTGNYDAYTFYNWAGIDIFCYFSHHLITIPPLGWINVGHEHGVKVIGTVITEWADGIKFWDKVLESEDEYKNFASALVAIAKTLKFDGWLLNVENKIEKPSTLLAFVKHLHTVLHQELADPVLIWYDSVTLDGQLHWQNGLNHKNRAFFDACDGLFTNYSWSEADVAASARAAGARLADLFIGIDVWGRNFFGGGQFNVQQAVDVAHKHGCSLAIFAPAWTHEAITMDEKDANAVALSAGLGRYEHFLVRDRALWHSIWRYLNTRLPCHLPFKTSFCRGQGKTRRLYGEVIGPQPWYNLRHMQYQPNASHGRHGFLLSTLDIILKISHTGILRDAKGFIKYRDDFNLQDVPPGGDDVTAGDRAEKPTEEPIETNAEHAEITPKFNIKRKIKNPFRHIFRHRRKSNKNNEQEIVEESEQTRALGDIPEQICAPDGEANSPIEKPNVHYDVQVIEVGCTKEASGPSLVNEMTSEADQIPKQDSHSDHVESNALVSTNNGKQNKTRYGLAVVADELQCLEMFYEDSFIGGGCLKINPSDSPGREARLIRLLQCDFRCENTLIICVVTKTVVGHEDQFLNLRIGMEGGGVVALAGRGARGTASAVSELTGPRFRDVQKYILLNEPGFYVPTENSYDWIVNYYEVQEPGARVTSINIDTGLPHGPILLGYFGVCEKKD